MAFRSSLFVLSRLPRLAASTIPTTATTTTYTFRPLSTSPITKMGITDWADKKDGSFKRQVSSFRDHIEEGGKFAPEKDRYHLYVSYACPWAHRALIVRQLKGLDKLIDYSVVHPHMLQGGWHFVDPKFENEKPAPASEHNNDTFPGATIDKVHKSKMLSDVYKRADPEYNARYTVPVIWDKKNNTIVNNESSEIIRDFNTGFNSILPEGEEKELDLYPENLRSEIDEINAWIYDGINNGVYKSGFATSQTAYNDAVKNLAESLDRVEKILSDGRDFLVGGQLTEADVRLFTTIVRYDPVYHGHFKCNWGSIRHDYPEINRWLKNLYWNYPAFKDTTEFDHIKDHYYYSHAQINPTRVVPAGPKYNIEPLEGDGKRKAEDAGNKTTKAPKV